MIRIKNNPEDKIPFSQLNMGDTFIDEDGDLMLRIDDIFGSQSNCVILTTGQAFTFHEDIMVKPVECEIEIVEKGV